MHSLSDAFPRLINETTLEVRSIFADLGLERFVRGKVYWEGDHVRLLLTSKDSKGISLRSYL